MKQILELTCQSLHVFGEVSEKSQPGRLAVFRHILDAATVGVIVGEILKTLDDPNLFDKAGRIAEEMKMVESSHRRASRRNIGFPLMRTRRHYFIEYGYYAFDLLDEILCVWICGSCDLGSVARVPCLARHLGQDHESNQKESEGSEMAILNSWNQKSKKDLLKKVCKESSRGESPRGIRGLWALEIWKRMSLLVHI